MGILDLFTTRAREKDAVHKLYGAIVAHARNPVFYVEYGVPDTVEGRFDMISLLAFIVLRRLRTGAKQGARLGQMLFDLMFADMDGNLREMGVGDLRVGKKVKELASLFYGRVAAYEEACGDQARMAAALKRNLYRSEDVQPALAEAMAAYVHAEISRSEEWPLDDLYAGELVFSPTDSENSGGDD